MSNGQRTITNASCAQGEKYDILMLSSSDWDGRWGSRQQVARELAARGHRVLFVERMAGLEHLAKYPDLRQRRLRRYREGVIEREARIWLLAPPPLLPGHYYADPIVRLNARLTRRPIARALQQLGFKRPLLWLFKPEHYPHLDFYDSRLSIYHCIDEFTVGTQGHKRRTIARLDETLSRRVDLLFANATPTYESRRRLNPHTYQIMSAANVAHFGQVLAADTEVAPEIAHLQGPVLIYLGNLDERIDHTLLARLAEQRPGWQIVLIGQALWSGNISEQLRAFKNIHLLGKRPFDELPRFLKKGDLCMIPYVQGEETAFRSPLKLYEYLATGRPIISTPHIEVDRFRPLITIAAAEAWPEAIDQMLNNSQADRDQMAEARLAAAAEHSWAGRVDTMLAAIADRLAALEGVNGTA